MLNTPQGRQRLQSQLGSLGQIYVNTLLISDARNEIDLVYGVYFDENGTMLGSKKFDVDGRYYNHRRGEVQRYTRSIRADLQEDSKRRYLHRE